jgi:vitamin B12 transporter
MFGLSALLVAGLVIASPQGTPAQQPTVAVNIEVIATATLTPTEPSQTARAVTVLTRRDLDLFGLTSAIEALRLAAGVDIRARGPRDVQSDLAVRGATFGQSLVLVDGVRTNDSQSGHHNGELPISLLALDRIEVVNGASSAVHGADALGGTINLLTRRDRHATAMASIGEHEFGASAVSVGGLTPRPWTLSAWGQRSSGFMFDRDFAMGGGLARATVTPDLTIDVRHQRRAFGANGFYGNSPSKEWTDQTLASTTWSRAIGEWTSSVRGTWKNHGDHFRWDIARPGFAENRHRTNSGEGVAQFSRAFSGGTVATIGAAGGTEIVRSSNLGDHDYRRIGAFAEVQTSLSSRARLQAGLRADHFTTFGSNVSPSVSVVAAPSSDWRLRASAGRAFRIPTYTELYYRDPANLGRDDLRAERGWSLDGGIDWTKHAWTVGVTPFVRWDKDVIDWVKAAPADLWRSNNIRDVTTRGLEVSAVRRWQQGALRVAYTALDVDAPSLNLISKYVLEYARHSLVTSVAAPLGAGFAVSGSTDYRRRLDGQKYTLVGARIARSWRRATAFVDASNLFDVEYHEVAGVAMPGRWMTVGVTVKF